MAIFKIQNKKLIPIKERKWPSEKHLQKLTEENLEKVFPDLQFVATEFPVETFRIDTLAFDKETSAFVIIEYKRGRSFSVIDQGYSYLSLMLRHKADFILEYNEKTKNSLGKKDVDWSQSRILFLAGSFTTHQKNAINFRDLPIELWEVELYDNSTVLYKEILPSEASESIKKITGDETIERVNEEVKDYTIEDDHTNKTTEEIRNLFHDFQERVLELSGTKEAAKKQYISYRVEGRDTFAYVLLRKNSIKIQMPVPQNELNDPKKISREINNYPRRTEIPLDKPAGLLYVLDLVEQCYRYTNQ